MEMQLGKGIQNIKKTFATIFKSKLKATNYKFPLLSIPELI